VPTSFSLQRFLMLAVAGASVFLLSFGPFIVNVSMENFRVFMVVFIIYCVEEKLHVIYTVSCKPTL